MREQRPERIVSQLQTPGAVLRPGRTRVSGGGWAAQGSPLRLQFLHLHQGGVGG